MSRIKSFQKLVATTFIAGLALLNQPALAATPYVMSGGDYAQDFSDIANWTANFAGGIGASNWSSVAANPSGTIPDGVKTTASTATFSASTSGGVQKGTGNIVLLSTGSSSENSTACAIDLNLDFSGRNAGTLSFDWAAIANSTGNRASSLRVYTSVDGTTWTELTGAEVLNVSNNVAASGSITTLALPAGLSSSATARIRFYECNGTGGSTGSRAKIAIDNVAVTSTGAQGVAPTITGITPASVAANAGDTVAFKVTSTGDAPTYFWYEEIGSNTNLIAGATTATLTLSNVLAADAASYQVVLSNATGTATSDVVTLTVADPVIISQPISLTSLVNATATFTVSANGTAPAYQWYVKPTADSDFTGAAPLINGGQISGATASSLSLANLTYATATNLFVVVTGAGNSVTSSVVTLTVASTASLALWDFNGNLNITNPVPAQGVGSASAVDCVTFSNAIASGNDFGVQNNAWGSSTYPALTMSNKLAGVKFYVSTVGAKNIKVGFDTRATSTASKYERLQFTTNGTDFIDYPDSSSFVQNVNYESRSFDLTGFPNVQNNASFGIRIVTEFESTAKYGATNDNQYVGNGGTYAGSGTVSYDLINISGDAITDNNTPPTITSFTNLTITDISGATNLNFTVGDAETPAASLAVAATSDNNSVISNPSVSGSGANLVLTITPSAGQLGVSPIRVTVTDGNGASTVTWFYVTVVAGNLPPTLSGLTSTNMLGNTTNVYPFTVGDDSTPVGSLTLSAISGNTLLISNANISFGGSGANRTLIVVPTTNTFGLAPISVMLSDGQKTTSLPLVFEVRPNTGVVLNDNFNYDSGGSIITASDGFWQTTSGTPGQVQAGAGQLFITGQNSEDINAPLINAPYYISNNAVLYSKFTVQFTALPTVGGTYFAHFKDTTTSGFEGRIWNSTLNAADGDYRLGIVNSAGTNSTAQYPLDLALGTNYTVVTRLVVTNGTTTIWINPTNESDFSVTDTTAVGGLLNISTYSFRQNVGSGDMILSNLVIGTSFNAIMGLAPAVVSIPLHIQLAGGQATLTWSDATFNLQSATNVAGPYTAISAAAGLTTYVDSVTNAAVFYRLQHP